MMIIIISLLLIISSLIYLHKKGFIQLPERFSSMSATPLKVIDLNVKLILKNNDEIIVERLLICKVKGSKFDQIFSD